MSSISVCAHPCRMAFAGAYSGDPHQARAWDADMVLGPSWARPSEFVIQVRPVCHGEALQGVICGSQAGGDLLRSPSCVSHPGRFRPPGLTKCPPVPVVRRPPRRGGRGNLCVDPTGLAPHDLSTPNTSIRVRGAPSSPDVAAGDRVLREAAPRPSWEPLFQVPDLSRACSQPLHPA